MLLLFPDSQASSKAGAGVFLIITGRIDLMKFRILSISTNLEDYPESADDTNEFPHLRKYVEDEQAILIIDEETNEVWPGDEFFMMVGLKRFESTE